MNPRNYKNLRLPGRITTPFGGRTKDEPVHPGVDIANVSGTPIPAFEDGVVTGTGPKTDGSGNVVTLKDKMGNTHQYGHLQNALVKPGTRVRKGQSIAKMGKSGNSYSPTGGDPSHLDVRIAKPNGQWENPMNYLNNQK